MKLKDVKPLIDKYFENVDPNHLLDLYNKEQQRKEILSQLKFYKSRLHLYTSSMKIIREKQIEILEKDLENLS